MIFVFPEQANVTPDDTVLEYLKKITKQQTFKTVFTDNCDALLENVLHHLKFPSVITLEISSAIYFRVYLPIFLIFHREIPRFFSGDSSKNV